MVLRRKFMFVEIGKTDDFNNDFGTNKIIFFNSWGQK